MKFQFVVLILAVALAVGASFHLHYTAQAAPELGGEATANAKTAKATAEPGVDNVDNHEIGDSFDGHANVVVCVAGDEASVSKGISVLIVRDFFRGKKARKNGAEVSKDGGKEDGKDASSNATLDGAPDFNASDSYKGGGGCTSS